MRELEENDEEGRIIRPTSVTENPVSEENQLQISEIPLVGITTTKSSKEQNPIGPAKASTTQPRVKVNTRSGSSSGGRH